MYRCAFWRKADIFPVTWNTDINKNAVGSISMPERADEIVSDDVLSKMCNLMSFVKLKAENSAVDAETIFSALKHICYGQGGESS